jgi:phosphoglycolate phosphatase-like HAD superfamily hydrolase
MAPRRIVLDADGVLVDFHMGYAAAWQRAFGVLPRERDAQAYWPFDRWDVERLAGERLAQFREQFDTRFWSSLPAIEGAVQACHRLHDAGWELVCVSALEPHHEASRLRNLRDLGFPIERVIATGHTDDVRSPKADAVHMLAPAAFVDDYLPYLRGIAPEIHTALVLRAPNGSPNAGDELSLVKSIHADLAAFAEHWLTR